MNILKLLLATAGHFFRHQCRFLLTLIQIYCPDVFRYVFINLYTLLEAKYHVFLQFLPYKSFDLLCWGTTCRLYNWETTWLPKCLLTGPANARDFKDFVEGMWISDELAFWTVIFGVLILLHGAALVHLFWILLSLLFRVMALVARTAIRAVKWLVQTVIKAVWLVCRLASWLALEMEEVWIMIEDALKNAPDFEDVDAGRVDVSFAKSEKPKRKSIVLSKQLQADIDALMLADEPKTANAQRTDAASNASLIVGESAAEVCLAGKTTPTTPIENSSDVSPMAPSTAIKMTADAPPENADEVPVASPRTVGSISASGQVRKTPDLVKEAQSERLPEALKTATSPSTDDTDDALTKQKTSSPIKLGRIQSRKTAEAVQVLDPADIPLPASPQPETRSVPGQKYQKSNVKQVPTAPPQSSVKDIPEACPPTRKSSLPVKKTQVERPKKVRQDRPRSPSPEPRAVKSKIRPSPIPVKEEKAQPATKEPEAQSQTPTEEAQACSSERKTWSGSDFSFQYPSQSQTQNQRRSSQGLNRRNATRRSASRGGSGDFRTSYSRPTRTSSVPEPTPTPRAEPAYVKPTYPQAAPTQQQQEQQQQQSSRSQPRAQQASPQPQPKPEPAYNPSKYRPTAQPTNIPAPDNPHQRRRQRNPPPQPQSQPQTYQPYSQPHPQQPPPPPQQQPSQPPSTQPQFQLPPFEPYAILGLQPTATPSEIRSAYKRQALLSHPDKFSDQPEHAQLLATQMFQHLQRAYEILSDDLLRHVYHLKGLAGVDNRKTVAAYRKAMREGGWEGQLREWWESGGRSQASSQGK